MRPKKYPLKIHPKPFCDDANYQQDVVLCAANDVIIAMENDISNCDEPFSIARFKT